ncbi:MAG TPA: hypothetical protein P5168_03935, partial [Candidatus Methanomethylicus sp.]|nr:hypothetical protein [Candidatus Methanomethylicus sp.]
QQRKLELLDSRLKSRATTLFDSCSSAMTKKDADRAKIYANELTEVKKVRKTVTNGLLLLEQLVLRMETLKEIGSTFAQLQPTLEVVKNISGQLSEVMPEVSNELSEIGSALDDAMISMNIGLEQEALVHIPESAMNDEILDQACEFLKDRLDSELPSVPNEVIVRKAIAIGGCEEEAGTDEEFDFAPVQNKMAAVNDFEPMKERALLEYLKENGGALEVGDCSSRCRIAERDLPKVIEGLSKKGLIRIQTVEEAVVIDNERGSYTRI